MVEQSQFHWLIISVVTILVYGLALASAFPSQNNKVAGTLNSNSVPLTLNITCQDDERFKKYYDEEDGKCRLCAQCNKGYQPKEVCGGGQGSNKGCEECPEGSYSESSDSYDKCRLCIVVCDNVVNLTQECTRVHDKTCGQCKPGFFKHVHGDCVPCSNYRPEVDPACEVTTKQPSASTPLLTPSPSPTSLPHQLDSTLDVNQNSTSDVLVAMATLPPTLTDVKDVKILSTTVKQQKPVDIVKLDDEELVFRATSEADVDDNEWYTHLIPAVSILFIFMLPATILLYAGSKVRKYCSRSSRSARQSQRSRHSSGNRASSSKTAFTNEECIKMDTETQTVDFRSKLDNGGYQNEYLNKMISPDDLGQDQNQSKKQEDRSVTVDIDSNHDIDENTPMLELCPGRTSQTCTSDTSQIDTNPAMTTGYVDTHDTSLSLMDVDCDVADGNGKMEKAAQDEQRRKEEAEILQLATGKPISVLLDDLEMRDALNGMLALPANTRPGDTLIKYYPDFAVIVGVPATSRNMMTCALDVLNYMEMTMVTCPRDLATVLRMIIQMKRHDIADKLKKWISQKYNINETI